MCMDCYKHQKYHVLQIFRNKICSQQIHEVFTNMPYLPSQELPSHHCCLGSCPVAFLPSSPLHNHLSENVLALEANKQPTVQQETFEGENVCEFVIFAEKLLRIVRFCCATTKGCHAPNFTEKTFAYSHKTAKFMKVFSFESFHLYGRML